MLVVAWAESFVAQAVARWTCRPPGVVAAEEGMTSHSSSDGW